MLKMVVKLLKLRFMEELLIRWEKNLLKINKFHNKILLNNKMEYKKVKKQVQMKILPMNLNNFKKITKLIQGLI